MDLNVERLGRSLVLTEDEGIGVDITSVELTENREIRGFLLVGRLLTPRAFRYDVLVSTLLAIIRPMRGMDVCLLADHKFLLRFNHETDRDRALRGCPWTFDRNLIILNKVTKEENPATVDLQWCPFYVHVHGLPIRLMTRVVAEMIGNRLGQFIEADQTHGSGASFRIRVSLDVRRPLLRVMSIRTTDGQRTISFTYERLPNLWLRSARSHFGDCPQGLEAEQVGEGMDLPYSAWLQESRSVWSVFKMESRNVGYLGTNMSNRGFSGPWGRSDVSRGSDVFGFGSKNSADQLGAKNIGKAQMPELRLVARDGDLDASVGEDDWIQRSGIRSPNDTEVGWCDVRGVGSGGTRGLLTISENAEQLNFIRTKNVDMEVKGQTGKSKAPGPVEEPPSIQSSIQENIARPTIIHSKPIPITFKAGEQSLLDPTQTQVQATHPPPPHLTSHCGKLPSISTSQFPPSSNENDTEDIHARQWDKFKGITERVRTSSTVSSPSSQNSQYEGGDHGVLISIPVSFTESSKGRGRSRGRGRRGKVTYQRKGPLKRKVQSEIKQPVAKFLALQAGTLNSAYIDNTDKNQGPTVEKTEVYMGNYAAAAAEQPRRAL
ncbi:UNVERIFIED_CONTAM: hypothetical protein Sradi_1578900 [Sesamum radiatum]|uniref:DUF4283 domain-containing protein n=1 Tax=Sesamum radiatum TaxID=300843 RepID=A0AAW2UA35_SESRA